jgi:hypothetical protein
MILSDLQFQNICYYFRHSPEFRNEGKEKNMFSLEELLGQQQGTEAVGQISQQVGAEPSLVNSAIQMALPAIIGGLANNASTPQGAESLNNALDQHDGSILDNLGGLGSLAGAILGGGQSSPQLNAGGILGHIFGNSQSQVTQQVSQNTGLGVGQVAQILMMLAPIVMGYLGRQKQTQGLDASGLASMLGGAQQQARSSGNPMIDMASSFLDSDHDGSAMDDIASMAFKYMTNR